MAPILLSKTMIDAMLADHRFAVLTCFKELPRLSINVQAARSSCCGSTPKVEPVPDAPLDYNQIKQHIDTAPVEDKIAIRKLLDCERVILQYKTPAGAMLKGEF